MNIAQIEINLQKLTKSFSKETFIFDLLLAYGLPKASITRLRKGNLNLSKVEGEISWKKKLFFKEEYKEDLHLCISSLSSELKHNQRFVIVTDYKTLLAIDTKTQDKLDIALKELPKHYDFFLPWSGMEKALHQDENPADIKAAEKMAKLFDEIKKDNPDDSPEFIHGLNVFLSRLLFCFFAEDTDIFAKNQFTNALDSHTQKDGSDLNSYFDTFFIVLNTSKKERKNLPEYLNAFPFVNGGLFEKKIKSPVFTRRSRQAIIDSGELSWSAINPDIFGSMIQAVITPEHRGGLGMHYTSVPNIMKVIEPLFLNDLYQEFERVKHGPKKLQSLLDRISKLKIFDPACGSGNFLIIAYKELRILEIEILQQLQTLQKAASGFAPDQLELIPKSQLTLAAQFQVELFSKVQLSQFYGIELDDFAHEIAILSLWLAQHQMNLRFKKVFGMANPTLPLQAGGNITHGNATRLDWEKVCPKEKEDEIYILGNPPYQGFKMQDKQQKSDLALIFNESKNYKFLDIISCWFLIASKYIDERVKVAFVSTNSICQGVQVDILWPTIFKKNVEIFFTHSAFKWSNNAKSNAGVTCVIIGLRKRSNEPKFIFGVNHLYSVKNINAYLIDAADVIIQKRRVVLSEFPEITDGSGALDGGHLILSSKEREELLNNFAVSNDFIRPYLGSNEFIKGLERWCIWIEDDEKELAQQIQPIKERIEKVREFRISAGTRAQTAIGRPHKFAWINRAESSQIIIPTVSSERRKYVPIGFLNNDPVVSNSASIIHNPAPYVFGIISSKIHMIWVKTVAGKLEERIRYTSAICYNTFPFPPISTQRKNEITQSVFRILDEREKYSDKTLAQLYDPDKMPDGLREAHRQNDLVIERCYRSKPFKSDEERLEYLFKLYEKMIAEEKEQGTLFANEKKTRKRKKS